MCPLFEGRKEIFNMKGYYSLGLAGYEVDIIDQDHIRWLFVGTDPVSYTHLDVYKRQQLNQYNVKNMFRDMKMDAKVTVELAKLTGTKGAAEERKKKAEMTVLDERVQNAVNKLIIRSIQGCIDRADKVYEGVKKVMDFRSKEGFFDRKGART